MNEEIAAGNFTEAWDLAKSIIAMRDPSSFTTLLNHDHPVIRTAAYDYMMERREFNSVQRIWDRREREVIRRDFEHADPNRRRYAVGLLGVVAPAVTHEAEFTLTNLATHGSPDIKRHAQTVLRSLYGFLMRRQHESIRTRGEFDLDLMLPATVNALAEGEQMAIAAQAVREVEAAAIEFYETLRSLADGAAPDDAALTRANGDFLAKVVRRLRLIEAVPRETVVGPYKALLRTVGHYTNPIEVALTELRRGDVSWTQLAEIISDPNETVTDRHYGYSVTPVRLGAARLLTQWLAANFGGSETRICNGVIFKGPYTGTHRFVDGFSVDFVSSHQVIEGSPAITAVLKLLGWKLQTMYDPIEHKVMAKVVFESDPAHDIIIGPTLANPFYATILDIGARWEQQDAHSSRVSLVHGKQVYVDTVADGHGFEGGVASQLAVEEFPKRVLEYLVESAEEGWVGRVIDAAIEDAENELNALLSRGGTSIVSAIQFDGRLHVVSVGDSRAYLLLRDGTFRRVTLDHVWDGNEYRYGITLSRALGSLALKVKSGGEITARPDVFVYYASDVATVLLCSDGIWHFVPDKKIEEIVKAGREPRQVVSSLLAAARENPNYLQPESGDNAVAVFRVVR